MLTHISKENNNMTVTVEGELNTITTPQLAKAVEQLQDVSMLIFDLAKVRYVSSAGLRLFLNCQRTMMAAGGDMLIRNCNEFVMETFESVGYNRIMKVEAESGTNKADARQKQ